MRVMGHQVGRATHPPQLAWPLTHGSFLPPSLPNPDMSSQETGLPQEWGSVEDDEEPEDSQVSWGPSSFTDAPPFRSPCLSGSLPQLGIPLPHKSLPGDGSPEGPSCGSQAWGRGPHGGCATPSHIPLHSSLRHKLAILSSVPLFIHLSFHLPAHLFTRLVRLDVQLVNTYSSPIHPYAVSPSV